MSGFSLTESGLLLADFAAVVLVEAGVVAVDVAVDVAGALAWVVFGSDCVEFEV
jgi:hypothetical protein